MIKSNHPNISIIDKAIYLWMLCTIEWMHERQEPISNNNLDRLFSPQIKNIFNFYRESAIEFKHLELNGLQLTPKGQKVVDHWKQLSDYILAID